MMRPRIISVNVGTVREVVWRGEVVRTGIWKSPVTGASVRVAGVNLAGDDQADRQVHGGPDKAVYAYAVEDYDWWQEQGLATEPGLFGENLTTSGIDPGLALVGERWRVGSTVLEVAQPRLPCFKLGIRLGDPAFPKRFLAAARLGAYLRIIEAGEITAGDPVTVISRPEHDVTLALLGRSVLDRSLAPRVLGTPGLPASFARMLGGHEA